MTWSTRQLAELADTTLKTVRHYHAIGLLEEPERTTNGYKQYHIGHLVRLLRIRRLAELGLPLAEIAKMEDSDESVEQALRALDAELAASIERQQRMRAQLATTLRDHNLVALPPGFDDESAYNLTETERAVMIVYSRVFDSAAVTALWQVLSAPRTPAAAEFDSLPADASEETRQRLTESYAPEIRRQRAAHPALQDPAANAPCGRAFATSVVQALIEYYNPAQRDVLGRIQEILKRDGDRPPGSRI